MKGKSPFFCTRQVVALFVLMMALCVGCIPGDGDIVKDVDGNVYSTIRIGRQVWLAENLRVRHYRNGDHIEHLPSDSAWATVTRGAWCRYGDVENPAEKYGHLYNWYAISDDRNIAPVGWHIPTHEEINELVEYLGGDTLAGIRMQGLDFLDSIPYWGKNQIPGCGFEAFPGGYRFGDTGTFHTYGSNGYWWTTSSSFELAAWSPRIFRHFVDVEREERYKNYGLAVRCIRDH